MRTPVQLSTQHWENPSNVRTKPQTTRVQYFKLVRETGSVSNPTARQVNPPDETIGRAVGAKSVRSQCAPPDPAFSTWAPFATASWPPKCSQSFEWSMDVFDMLQDSGTRCTTDCRSLPVMWTGMAEESTQDPSQTLIRRIASAGLQSSLCTNWNA